MLKPIENSQLEMILAWRNAPHVRKMMFTQHLISNEEHCAWWNNLLHDQSESCRVYYFQGKPSGLVTYYNINPAEKECYWGFFMNNEQFVNQQELLAAWLTLGKEAVTFAFNNLLSKRLLCETFVYNETVLKFNHLIGFKKINSYQRTVSGKSVEVITMELTKSNWEEKYETK